jgi:hypothetical protein
MLTIYDVAETALTARDRMEKDFIVDVQVFVLGLE